MEAEKRLMVIDSNALLHRAFHALPPLKNSSGEETGAVYGFLLTFFKAVNDLKPNYIAACFDEKGKNFRHEKFQEYKATRMKTPDGIIAQIPLTKEVLHVLDIPVFSQGGVEADDVIATICTLAPKQDPAVSIYIVSGDMDNLQLVNKRVNLYTLSKGIKDVVVYTPAKVKERFGVDPSQMVEFKALTGDASDNVPGVKGIGQKTAAEIIQKYGTIDALYQELATDTAVLKPKVKEALKANKAEAFLSRELVETKKDVDISFELQACKFGGFNLKEAEALFKKMEFNSLINRLPSLTNS